VRKAIEKASAEVQAALDDASDYFETEALQEVLADLERAEARLKELAGEYTTV